MSTVCPLLTRRRRYIWSPPATLLPSPSPSQLRSSTITPVPSVCPLPLRSPSRLFSTCTLAPWAWLCHQSCDASAFGAGLLNIRRDHGVVMAARVSALMLQLAGRSECTRASSAKASTCMASALRACRSRGDARRRNRRTTAMPLHVSVGELTPRSHAPPRRPQLERGCSSWTTCSGRRCATRRAASARSRRTRWRRQLAAGDRAERGRAGRGRRGPW